MLAGPFGVSEMTNYSSKYRERLGLEGEPYLITVCSLGTSLGSPSPGVPKVNSKLYLVEIRTWGPGFAVCAFVFFGQYRCSEGTPGKVWEAKHSLSTYHYSLIMNDKEVEGVQKRL